jgi:hypothetical protein
MLFFLNNANVLKAADAVAAQATAAAGDDPGRVQAAYRLLFARSPSAAELQAAAGYLKQNSFNRYCHVLLCASEFIYLD